MLISLGNTTEMHLNRGETMSNYILTSDGELMHYGVPGMKWGKRMARGHAGPGQYITRKRQLAGDKRDLERLNKGGHLSIGLTKKRQAAYDARDKAALEKRIAKNEAKMEKPTNPNRKREIAIAATAVAGTALAAYGTYKVSKMIKDKHMNKVLSSGERALKSAFKNGYDMDRYVSDYADIFREEHSRSAVSTVKYIIDNNSVRGKVNWKDIYKNYIKN